MLQARLARGTLFGGGGAHDGIVGCRVVVVLLAIVRSGGHGTFLGLGRRGVSRSRGSGNRGAFSRDSVISLLRGFFVAGERDVCGGFEELLPELGAFPDIARVLCIFLDHREDAGGNYAVGTTEVVIDFYGILCQLTRAVYWKMQAHLEGST